jgi:hypothetical protein
MEVGYKRGNDGTSAPVFRLREEGSRLGGSPPDDAGGWRGNA